jgi:RNA 3'-terminal phosphate cyclase-like protein
MDSTQKEVLRFRGVAHFRQRLVFATLAKRRLRIDGIREKEESPGLRPFEASFLRLLEKLTNGCRIEINETGTTLKYVPGWIVGGTLEHDCGVGRSIGWFLEGILPLMPFGKKAAALTLTGSTSDDTDVSVDLLKTVHLPTLTHFGIADGLRLDILARGCPPNGGGRVFFACPVMRELQPISLTEEGFIKRIRGLSYTCKVSPQLSNRIVEAAR